MKNSCIGCGDETALNYDEEALYDDGNCEFGVAGCTDESACNFDEAATINEGCEYAEAGLDCDGNCIDDADADGICDELDDCIGELDACGICNGPGEIYECGCQECECDDIDEDGICDDEDDCVGALDDCGVCNGGNVSCTGCMNDFACNFDPEATINDNDLCDYESCQGCMEETACNYDPEATFDDGTNCVFIATGECDCGPWGWQRN